MRLTPRIATATVAQVRRSWQALDLDLPADVEQDHDRHDTVLDRAADLGAPPEAKAAAVLAAIHAGRDPAVDPAVQRAVTAESIATVGLHEAVVGLSTDRTIDTYRANLPAIFDTLRARFDQARDDLADAYGTLGDVDLADTDTIVAAGPDAADAWATATTATTATAIITDAWLALLVLLTGQRPRQHKLLIIADAEPSRVLDDQLADADADAWTAVTNGYDLDLANFDQFAQRVAAVETEADTRTEAAEAARKANRVPFATWK